MKKTSDSSEFIFYLTLDEKLPNSFYVFDVHFRELGLMLVPVKVEQLQTLLSSSEQQQILVMTSVTDAKEFQLYNQRIRKYLKYFLKSKRLTFLHLSSFSKLNDQKAFAIHKNYHFIKYPFNARELAQGIAKLYMSKKDQLTIWPGGRRTTLGTV